MTRNVNNLDGICQCLKIPAQPVATKVYLGPENKALRQRVPRTKVTTCFGEGGANIRYGCDVRRDIKNRTYEGKFRDAETEGFFTYRAADRGGDHPDHRSNRDSELASRPHGGQRVVCCLVDSYHQHGGSYLQLDLSDHRLCREPEVPWWTHRRGLRSCNSERLLD